MSRLTLYKGLLLNLAGEIPRTRQREFMEVHEALEELHKLTGQDFGDDVEAWRAWLSKNGYLQGQATGSETPVIQKIRWTPVSDETDPDHQLMQAAVSVARGEAIAECPLCEQDGLRYYLHRWEHRVGRRATVWVWCNECSYWTHVSGLQPTNVGVNDPLSDIDIAGMEGIWFIEKLNALWERGVIPAG